MSETSDAFALVISDSSSATTSPNVVPVFDSTALCSRFVGVERRRQPPHRPNRWQYHRLQYHHRVRLTSEMEALSTEVTLLVSMSWLTKASDAFALIMFSSCSATSPSVVLVFDSTALSLRVIGIER